MNRLLVGTSRCDVPARASAGRTGSTAQGGADGAARRPIPVHGPTFVESSGTIPQLNFGIGVQAPFLAELFRQVLTKAMPIQPSSMFA